VNTLSYKTISANAQTVKREWFIIDAQNLVTGRLATKIATLLRGKHKASYTPHVDCGDYVIVVNAEKVRFTGSKMAKKEYISHSGYPGGQKRRTPAQMLTAKPKYVVEHAVKGMLPKNRLGRAMFKKMFVYAGSDHPHQAQQPKKIEL